VYDVFKCTHKLIGSLVCHMEPWVKKTQKNSN